MEYYGTLGPSCQDSKLLSALFREGMTGVRLNLSHMGLEGCAEWLEHLRRAARETIIQPQLLIDLQGPELRIGALDMPVMLQEGESLLLGEGGVPVPELLPHALIPGSELLLDDGIIRLRTVCCTGNTITCTVLRGGVLRSRKSIAVPGMQLHPPTLTSSDYQNLKLAKQCGVTGVMLPFVRGPEDLRTLRQALRAVGAPEIRVFAKLENRAGLARLSELLPYADQIVIARGDLGNDMPLWELPAAQKDAAVVCRKENKSFMVVTQLLHSMHHAAVPTRAEVLDIFNAVLDGASSLMLTGETAVGQYPVEAMRYLVQTAEQALVYLEREKGEKA